MNMTFRSAACTLLLCAPASVALAATPSPSTEPLVQPTNLVYLGAFKLPQIACQAPTYACFGYGGTGITYDSTDNSLYIVGHPYGELTAEVSIPTPAKSSNPNDLPTATLLQGFSDPLDGKRNSVNPDNQNPRYIGGQLVYDGKLIVSAYSYYDGAVTQTTSHFVRPLNLSATAQVAGPFRVGTQYPGFVDGYMTPIPPEWQTLLGGPALTGNCCLAIISAQSNGPAASVFDPSTLGNQNPTSAIPLVGYPESHPVSYEDKQSSWGTTSDIPSSNNTTIDIFNGTTKITGILFPVGTRSVLFFGTQGTGQFCYGPGTSTNSTTDTSTTSGAEKTCYDPANSSKGTHGFPYQYQVWAYDADDLLKVKNGTEPQYTPQPYDIWPLTLPFSSDSTLPLIGGVAYDPATNRVYISQECVYTNCSPLIEVFRVDMGGSPSPPGDIAVN